MIKPNLVCRTYFMLIVGCKSATFAALGAAPALSEPDRQRRRNAVLLLATVLDFGQYLVGGASASHRARGF